MAKKLLKLSTLLGVVLVIFLLAGCPLTQPKFTLYVSTEGQGDVNLAPAEGPYVKGTTVTLTAVPEEGWEFVEWSGDLSGSDNPESLVMDEEKSVTAHFEEKAPIPTITFVSVPDDVCGTDEFDVVVEVSDASTVTFLLQKDEETPIEPIDVVKSGDTYTVTFEAPDLTENKNYELEVFAENEDESNTKTTGVYILKTDEMLPQISLMEFYEIPECNATSTVIEFGVCDETAIDVNSLRFEANEGEVEYELGDIGEYCLTNGQATWTFEDVDCKELEITMFISDKCGNEASRTLTLDIDN
ncbi:MAG: InlB B-repeat-containing protein, partial [Kosmotogaceae bacterium]